jgi:hypothetical protein
MDFEIVGDVMDVETIAIGKAIRELPRLRRLYGKGRWRKMKGAAHIRLKGGRLGSQSCIGMRRTALARKNSSASGSSTRRRSPSSARRFAVCIDNSGYEVSLERNKLYVVLADEDAERDGDVRVVDESGEDYWFAANRFIAIDVPAAVKASLLKAS